ncbi:MAG: hypothetical protein ACHQWU_00190 [Gemmatimonadales bacterium]
MRILWTLLKIAIGLAIAIPVGLFVMAMTVGIVGTVVGLVAMAVRLACIGLVGYGLYRVGRFFFAPRGRARHEMPVVRELPSADPYYAAAMRELDSELRG